MEHQPNELIWGAAAIARTIGRTQRQTYHLLESGSVPARRVGKRWVADRARLLAFFAEPAAMTGTNNT